MPAKPNVVWDGVVCRVHYYNNHKNGESVFYRACQPDRWHAVQGSEMTDDPATCLKCVAGDEEPYPF